MGSTHLPIHLTLNLVCIYQVEADDASQTTKSTHLPVHFMHVSREIDQVKSQNQVYKPTHLPVHFLHVSGQTDQAETRNQHNKTHLPLHFKHVEADWSGTDRQTSPCTLRTETANPIHFSVHFMHMSRQID